MALLDAWPIDSHQGGLCKRGLAPGLGALICAILGWIGGRMGFDREKLGEYKFRAVLSLLMLAGIAYAAQLHGLRGPALFEIGLMGGGFALLSLAHALWAIWKIKQGS